jgi:calcineurin-like phosphoesterase family protein
MNYFTSDYHFCHKNVLEMCQRPYTDIDSHDDDIIQRHNSVVADSDDIWDLGDIAYRCSAEDCFERIKRLNGKRHIIMGNHDKPLRQAYKKGLFKSLINSGKLEIIGGEMAINDSTLAISKMINIEGQQVFLSHYAYKTWPGAFRGTIMLYGHSHGNLTESKYKSFDVGVDSHNYYPWSWTQVKERISKITIDFSEKDECGDD